MFNSHLRDQADEVDWQSTRSEPLYHNLPVSHTTMGCQTQWLATCIAWPFSSARLDGRKFNRRRISVIHAIQHAIERLGSQGTDRLDRVPRGKEVRARVIESLRSREPAATVGKTLMS